MYIKGSRWRSFFGYFFRHYILWFYWYWCRISKEKNNWVKKNRKADLWNRAWPSRLRFKKNARWSCSWKNAFHFLHFENTKWNFLVDALNVYRFCFQASSSFYQWLLILFKSFLTVARSYLFHIFLLFLYSLLFFMYKTLLFYIDIFRYMRLAMLCSMSASALCCHPHALILKHAPSFFNQWHCFLVVWVCNSLFVCV